MEFLMILLFSFIFTFVLVSAVMLIADWNVHKRMVEEYAQERGRASYATFLKEFNKYEWSNEISYGSIWKGSLWAKGSNDETYIHASIIKFNNIGMIMKTPIDWLQFLLHMRKNSRKINKPKYEFQWESE